MIILGIESSCDETSIAIIQDGKQFYRIIFHLKLIFIKNMAGGTGDCFQTTYQKYCGNFGRKFNRSKDKSAGGGLYRSDLCSRIDWSSIGRNFFCKSFGLCQSYSLDSGSSYQRAYLCKFLEHEVELPCISLVVSGGHTNIIYMDEKHEFHNLGGTLDDAVGESCDKVARVLGLGYPGGPIIDKMYYQGNPQYLKLTKPKVKEYEFSFSGIKTAVINFDHKMKLRGESYKKRIWQLLFRNCGRYFDGKTIAAAKEKGKTYFTGRRRGSQFFIEKTTVGKSGTRGNEIIISKYATLYGQCRHDCGSRLL